LCFARFLKTVQYHFLSFLVFKQGRNPQCRLSIVDVNPAFTMDHLFSPCTRYRDIAESEGRLNEFEDFPEELALDVSTEDLLSAERAFTFADLYTMLGNGEDMVAWLTPHASVMQDYNSVILCSSSRLQDDDDYALSFIADGEQVYAMASSLEHIFEICNVVLRLLAASVVHSVILRTYNPRDRAWINSASLTYLMDQCQSLKSLTLEQISLDENHCRVLGARSRPDLEITLENCAIAGAGARALAEVLASNQGPSKLDECVIDNFHLGNGLRGNSRLKSLRPRIFLKREAGNQGLLTIAGALKENKGLVDLNIYLDFGMSDETWYVVCDSLKTHPTLQILTLRDRSPTFPARINSRIQALVDMLKVNRSIHTIHPHSRLYSEHELFRASVIPSLETNRLRPRVRAIQKTRPMLYRAKVLGRALLAARTDVNCFWMLLSGNPEVAFPSRTATTTPVANLPAPAPMPTAAATVNVAAVTADVDATRGTSTAGASAAANVATPTARQKRQARP
jgi:hypothetical protein